MRLSQKSRTSAIVIGGQKCLKICLRNVWIAISSERYRGLSDRKEKLEEVRKHQFLLPHSNCVHFYQSWEDNGRLYQKFELCQKSLMDVSEEKHDLPESLVRNF